MVGLGSSIARAETTWHNILFMCQTMYLTLCFVAERLRSICTTRPNGTSNGGCDILFCIACRDEVFATLRRYNAGNAFVEGGSRAAPTVLRHGIATPKATSGRLASRPRTQQSSLYFQPGPRCKTLRHTHLFGGVRDHEFSTLSSYTPPRPHIRRRLLRVQLLLAIANPHIQVAIGINGAAGRAHINPAHVVAF